MNLISIGKIVNTHGLRGEIRIISDSKFKAEIFSLGNKIYINGKEHIILSYRVHKVYDMVKVSDINNIEDASLLKGSFVYINRENLKINGYLNQDLIGLSVYDEKKYMGKIVDIITTNQNDIFIIDGVKRHMVPNIDEFVRKIDLKNKKINIKYIKGLANED